MFDFTSALYLQMLHPPRSLDPWTALTTGRPASLGVPPDAEAAAAGLAALQGCAGAVLYPSTLHAFWDLGGLFDPARDALLVDDGSYPIAPWGLGRQAVAGLLVRRFTHHDPRALAGALDAHPGRRPIVACDGFCPGCGAPAPLAAYLKIVRARGGCLVVDDTQALGILGHNLEQRPPYGTGGGGSLQASGLRDPSLVVVASLAKGFGVPIAVAAGARPLVNRLLTGDGALMHASPPSQAHLVAARAALRCNLQMGEQLRDVLARRVKFFRQVMRAAGVGLVPSEFPVQTLRLPPSDGHTRGRTPAGLHRALLRRGVRTVLHDKGAGRPALSFILTVAHPERALRAAATAVAWALKNPIETGRPRRLEEKHSCGRPEMACN